MPAQSTQTSPSTVNSTARRSLPLNPIPTGQLALGDIDEVPNSRSLSGGIKAQQIVWRDVPLDVSKRIQETFVKPENRQVRFDGQSIAIKDIPFDPELIPVKFVVDLKLMSAPERKSDLNKKLAELDLSLEVTERIVSGIKLILESADSFGFYNQRAYVITNGTKRQSNYPLAPRVDSEIVGSILYFSKKPSDSFPKSKISFYENIYDARRKTVHVTCKYVKEAEKVKILQTGLENTNFRFNHESWKDSKGVLQKIGKLVAEDTAEVLKLSQAPCKKKARDAMLGACFDKGSSQPMARMVGARNGLIERSGEITGKERSNHGDGIIFYNCIVENNEFFRLISEFCKEAAKIVEQKNFNKSTLVNLMDLKIGSLFEKRPSVQVRPFTVLRDRLEHDFLEFKVALYGDDLEGIRIGLVKMFAIVKQNLTNHALEQQNRRIVNDPSISPDSLIKDMEKIQAIRNGRHIFPKFIYEPYRSVYERMDRMFEILTERLKLYERLGVEDEDLARCYEKYREDLDAVDIELLTNAMPMKSTLRIMNL